MKNVKNMTILLFYLFFRVEIQIPHEILQKKTYITCIFDKLWNFIKMAIKLHR